jgi:hypothetical protein
MKPMQISAVTIRDMTVVYVLCDDGTIWRRVGGVDRWEQIPDIHQPETSATYLGAALEGIQK